MVEIGELTEELLLAGSQGAWRFKDDLDQFVPPATAADIGHPATLQPQDVAALGSARNMEPVRAVEGGDFNIAAEHGLGKADRDLTKQVVPVPLEERMLPDQYLNP